MPFPESSRVYYANNPLIEVVCQIRFPAILRITAGDVSDFQEKIREDYPLYELEEPSPGFTNMPKEMATLVEQLMPKTSGPRAHKFLTRDRERFISLSQDFLALSETNYDKWGPFREEIKKAIHALSDVYEPAFFQRLGLRYIDAIYPTNLDLKEAKWSELLSPQILAELGDPDLANAIDQIRTQCVIKLSEIGDGQVKLTHGLAKDKVTSQQFYLIDADFSVENVEALEDAIRTLNEFNRLAGRLFRWAITDTLHEAMGPGII